MLKQPQEPAQIQHLLVAAHEVIELAVKPLKKYMNFDLSRMPVGAAADLLFDIRALRQQLGQLTAPLEELLEPAAKRIEQHFVDTLAVGESSGIQGMRSRVQVTDSSVPNVENWDLLYKFILKNKAFELLNRAVNREAVRERWDAKKQVPGVKAFHVKKVSCTKLGGKK